VTERPEAGRGLLPRSLKLLGQLALTALLTWFILRAVGFNLRELRAFDLSDLEPGWGFLTLSVLVLLASYLYAASLWGLMVREIGIRGVGLLSALKVFFTANLGRYLPGKLWQIAGLAFLARGEGVSPGTATGAAILGQGFALAGATLLGAGVLLEGGAGGGLWGGWGAPILLVVLLAATSPVLLKRLLPLWFRLARQGEPGGFRPDSAFGVRWMGLYALSWLGQGVAFFLLARGLGFEITLLEGVPSYAAAYVVGYLALFAPAGVGVREGMIVALLGPSLGAGAAVLALAARLWATIVEVVPAMAFGSKYLRSGEKGGSEVV
jgi:hypothetical protein